MNRNKKLGLNMIMGLGKQLVTIICGFILPVYILRSYGSAVNGLVSSITQFLAFISFLEMGVGSVIQSNLYKPLAENDMVMVSSICKSSERFFKRIAYIFVAYIAILIIIFPKIEKSNFGFIFNASLIIIISVSSFAQYYFGITYQLLLNADQKSYIQLGLQTLTVVLNTILSVILMKMGASIHLVKLVASALFVIRPIIMMIYVKKRYSLDKNVVLKDEPIQQKWNGFAQHLASVVVSNTDIVLLTIFSSLENVSVYSVYYMVVRGITDVVMTAVTGLEAMWGNMIAKNENKKLVESFEFLEWALHLVITFLFSITALSIVSFVKVYTRGITDANYDTPKFAILIVLAYAFLCLRVPYFRMIKSAGHYKQTQNGSLIQMVLNIVISIILVINLGLEGVAIGTLVAMGYHTVYFVIYLKNNILNRRLSFFIKNFMVDSMIFVLSYVSTKFIHFEDVTYSSWILFAFKVSIICFAITLLVNIIFYYDKFRIITRKIKKINA